MFYLFGSFLWFSKIFTHLEDTDTGAVVCDFSWIFDADAGCVLKEPNRIITVDEHQVLIQLQNFNSSQVSGWKIISHSLTICRRVSSLPWALPQQVGIPEGIQGEKAEMFSIILSQEGCTFTPADVLEAVQACRDIPSALKYLSHDCPICQEQVSFSKVREHGTFSSPHLVWIQFSKDTVQISLSPALTHLSRLNRFIKFQNIEWLCSISAQALNTDHDRAPLLKVIAYETWAIIHAWRLSWPSGAFR